MSASHPPSVDRLRRALAVRFDLPPVVLTDIARTAARQARDAGSPDAEDRAVRIAASVAAAVPRRAVNATGVIVHTNLGRSPLHPDAVASMNAAAGYGNTEIDLGTGERGGRGRYARTLLRALTGAEDALVVNNNAAAVMLALMALASGRQVPVSRGELIEIGGSYRLPDLMAATGSRMVEVGTTNRTRLADYAAAMDEATGILLKVHPSNYRIEGFTEETPIAELARLGAEHGVPVAFDVGSGLLDTNVPWIHGPPPQWLHHEPGVRQALADGADLVLFSGDKLLGGPQAGIAVGRADLIEQMRRHPVARAVRIDGATHAALAATLEHYARGSAASLPVWRMALLDAGSIGARARAVIADSGVDATLRDGVSAIGGGSVPGSGLPTALIELPGAAERWYTGLLMSDPPIVARREEGRTVLDLRTVAEADDSLVAATIARLCRS